jgi:protein-S-isoprenylcysteine O-methyltransferase Ste14
MDMNGRVRWGRRTSLLNGILTIAAGGQIVLSFLLYNKGGSVPLRHVGWVMLWLSAVFGLLPIYSLWKWGGVGRGRAYVHTTQLVDGGIYAIVRHPQYVAGMLIAVGLSLIAQHWLVVVLGAVAFVVYYIDMFEEERFTLEKLGECYQEYMDRVPRANFIAGVIRVLRGGPD